MAQVAGFSEAKAMVMEAMKEVMLAMVVMDVVEVKMAQDVVR